MKTKQLFLLTLFMLLSTFVHAQVAQMNVEVSYSNAAPNSGDAFTLNLTLTSQATGEAVMLSGTTLTFDLPANVEILSMPETSDGLYTITTSTAADGKTHVVLTYNSAVPTGMTKSFSFLLKYANGISVHDSTVDNIDVEYVLTATNCMPDTETANLNPTNIPLPAILNQSKTQTDGPMDAYHTLKIVLDPEACSGGLNHTDAQVAVKVPVTSLVGYITMGGVTIPTPTPTAPDGDGNVTYLINMGDFDVCNASTGIDFFFTYNDATPTEHDIVVTYTATRYDGTPVTNTKTITETPTSGNPVPIVFSKAATSSLSRPAGAGQAFSYTIAFTPVYAVDNIVIIDNPITNEAQFFDVNRFTKIAWAGVASPTGLTSKTYTKVSYEYSNAVGTWVDVFPDARLAGQSPDFTTDGPYVTKFKIEFYNEDGTTKNIAANVGGVTLTISAVTTANITDGTTYIPDNLLNNTMYVSGTVKGTAVTNEAFQSVTELTTPRIKGYLDWGTHPLWYSRNALEATLNSGDYPWNILGVTGATATAANGIAGIPLNSTNALRVGDEFWFTIYTILEDYKCKDYGFMFIVESPYVDVIDVAAGYGIGLSRDDYPYEVYKTPEGYSVVKVKVDGNRARGNWWGDYEPVSNNPFTVLGWENNNYPNRQNIGIKLRVKSGANGFYSIIGFSGTTNFDQPFGNGGDIYGNSYYQAAWTSGAIQASTGQFHRFDGRDATVFVNNTMVLSPTKTASLDGINYQPSISSDNRTADQTVYYKLHIENATPGIVISKAKIIDVLPAVDDKMVLNEVARNSNIALTNVSIYSVKITDNNGNVTMVALPDANFSIYTSTTVSAAANVRELADVTFDYNTTVAGYWTALSGTALPSDAKSIKIVKTDGLATGYKLDVVLQATLPTSADANVAWNSMGVGGNYTSGSSTYNIASSEPGKSAIRGKGPDSDGAISGIVWNDVNKNGIRDLGEPVLPNIRVSLYDGNDAWYGDYLTLSDGTYTFTDLVAGNWFVKVTPEAFVSPYQQGSDRTVDCDFVKIANNAVAVVAITATTPTHTHIDCGLYDEQYIQTEVMCAGQEIITLDYKTRPAGTPYWFATAAAATSATSPADYSTYGASYAFTKNSTDALESMYLRFASDDKSEWLSSRIDRVDIYLTPDTLVWTGTANDNDWNNYKNWSYPEAVSPWEGASDATKAYMIPRQCTNVYIDKVNSLPDLNPAYTTYSGVFKNAECNNIHFAYVSGVARTDSLHYAKAFVELELNTNKWSTLSAPLRDMYSGDYAFRPITPLVLMRVFNSPNPQTAAPAVVADWSQTFNTDTVRLVSTMGYNVRVGSVYYPSTSFMTNPDEGLAPNAAYTILTKKIWDFPKSDFLYKHYNQYTYVRTPGEDQQLPTTARNKIGRFTYESAAPYTATTFDANEVKVLAKRTISNSYAGDDVLLGNPFMGYIDFAAFYKANHQYIKPEFTSVIDGVTTKFTAEDASNSGIFTNMIGDRFIRPMQAFIVALKAKPANLVFYDRMSVLKNQGSPNHAPARLASAAMFEFRATRGQATDYAIVQIYPEADNAYNSNEESRLMIHSSLDPLMMHAFFEVDGMYVWANRINAMPDTLPLGIITSGNGTTLFEINGFVDAETDGRYYFKDKHLNHVAEITSNHFTYTFSETGDQIGRFVIYKQQMPTDNTENKTSKDLLALVDNNVLTVTALDGSDIIDIEVMDVTGRVVYRATNVNNTSYKIQMNTMSEVLIVRSKTHAGTYVNKIINK